MMRIQKKENGTLFVPTRVEADGIIGDGMLEIPVDHKEYAMYLAEYEWEQSLI